MLSTWKLLVGCGVLVAIVIAGLVTALLRPIAAGRMRAERQPDPYALSTRLRRLRTGRGLLLRELAQRVGLTANYVNQLELGTKVNPSLDTLQRIARVYGLTVPELLTWVPDSIPLHVHVTVLRADVERFRARQQVDMPRHFDALAGLLDILERLLPERRDR